MQVLVVGLDGVGLPVLDSMSDEDTIPRLDSFRENGTVAPLTSQLPPWTPSAWPSMYTGVNPGKHGVYDFFHFDGYDGDVVNRSRVKEYAIWELLSMRGLSSVVLNVPVTHPPREFDGVLVPGYIAPENPTCHPAGVWDELERQLGSYSLYGSTLDSTASDAELVRDLVDLTQMRGEAFRYLLDEHDPAFGFVQFQTTDTVYHDLPGDEDAIRRVYGAVDQEVGRILDATDPELTLVVSDHGIGPMDGYEFRVNDFLHDGGWVVPTAEGDGMPSWKSVTRERDGGLKSPVDTLAKTGIKLSARAGLTSQRISTVLQSFGLEKWVRETVPVDLIRAGTEQVDFPASTAYMRTRTEMGIRLNLDGREPAGTVPASAYEEVRNEVIEALRQVTTPDGTPLFERVAQREEIFEGPYLEDAPDIVIVPARFDHFLVANLKGSNFGDPTEPYEHKRDGVLIAAGAEIDPTADVADAHLFDVAPTILASFGLPVSDRMDGEALPIIGSTGIDSYPSFDGASVGTDAAAVTERLSDLGYLQ